MLSVELSIYESKYKASLEAFDLPEEQRQFTGMPDRMLALAMEDKHRHPVVILARSEPVGFFILYDGEELKEYTDNPASLLLRGFSINHAEQGNGYATKGLLQLPGFVQEYFPYAEEIVLAVNEQNKPAKSLYLKCGFHDHGRTKIGRIGMQHILCFPLTQPARSQFNKRSNESST